MLQPGEPVCLACRRCLWGPRKGSLGMSIAALHVVPWLPGLLPSQHPHTRTEAALCQELSPRPQLPATLPPALAGLLEHPRAAHSILWHSWGQGIPDSPDHPSRAGCCLGWDTES